MAGGTSALDHGDAREAIIGVLECPPARQRQRYAVAGAAAHDAPRLRAESRVRALALMHRVGRRNGLAPIAPDDCFGQMVPVPVRCTDAEALRRRLFEHHRIEVPVTTHGAHAFVRVSVMPYTRDDELDALELALAAERV